MNTKAKLFLLSGIAILIIMIDQYSKYIIRTDPYWQYIDLIPGWLGFHYTLNPGMALGIDLLSTPVVSSISILAALGIITFVLYHLKSSTTGYVALMGLVIGGAFGNIIDRLFLGPIQGHEGLLQGRVVDFIHFYFQVGDTPVFPYIFNVADMAISTAIITLLIFHKRLMPDEVTPPTPSETVLEQKTE